MLSLAATLAMAGSFAAEPAGKTFDLALVRGTIPDAQRTLRVEKGDAVRLRVTSDTAGELHVHGYRVTAKIAAGMPADIAFRAFATGRYPIEWHAAAKAPPLALASKAAGHHGPPLATLEVRPK